MLQWADTFNSYGTNTALMLDGLYAAVGSGTLVADPDPSATGSVLLVSESNVSSQTTARMALSSGPLATVGFAFRGWISTLPSIDDMFVGFVLSDINNVAQLGVKVKTTGALEVLRGVDAGGSNGTSLYITPTPVIAPNSWNHFELEVTIDNSAGAVELRVNGVTKIDISGADTQATANASVAQTYWNNYRNFNFPGNSPNLYVKDFLVWDTTGTQNNDFFGTVSVIDLPPDGDDTFTWTPSTGTTGFNILDNRPPLDDSAYISAATPLTSIFTLTDLPTDITSVRGLVVMARAKKIDGGDGNIQTGMVSGASTGLGTNRPITTAYTYWYDVNELDPAASAPWTPVSLNAAKIQIARTV